MRDKLHFMYICRMKKFLYKITFALFILFVVALHNPMKAQQELGLKAGLGMTKLSGTFAKYSDFQKWEYPAPSFHIGGFYNYNLSKNIGLGVELLYTNVGGKQSYQKNTKDSLGNINLQHAVDLDYHMSYLSIPLYVYYDIKKIRINIGIQNGFLLREVNKQTTTTIQNTDTNIVFVNNKLQMNKYSVGIKVGAIYKINNILSIEGNYWFYKTHDEYPSTWKVQQVIFGLRYKIYPKTACATCPGGF